MRISAIKSWAPLLIILVLLGLFFGLGLNKYVSFANLRDNHEWLIAMTKSHFYLASLIFILVYTVAVALSIPGAIFLTLIGGFLFGILWGTFLVVLSATLGATILFFAVQSSLGEVFAKRASGWVSRMRSGFKDNAFSYLLTLRLIPLFPFWVINIVSAVLGVSASTFIIATFIGIIPGSIVYVSVGNGLGELFAANLQPNLGIIFEPQFILPLLGLAALSLIPVFYKKKSKQGTKKMKDKDLFCDLAIIGGGAAGLSIAAGCSQLGLQVVLVEPNKMGGDCLNYGCVPSKTLLNTAKIFYQTKHSTVLGIQAKSVKIDFLQVMQQVHNVIASIEKNDSVERFTSLGVQVIQEKGHFIGPKQFKLKSKIIQAKHFVIATGSSPAIPPIKNLNKVSYLTNETIFNLNVLPEHLIVIGGGPIGCELAQAFAMLGSKVTILEAFTILPKDDADCVAIVRSQLESMQVAVYEHIKIEKIEESADKTISVHLENHDNPITITGSHVLVSAGRVANVGGLDLEKAGVEYTTKGINTNARLQTTNKKIYAIGDVTGPYQFTHMASYQAGIALRNIAFKWPAKIDYKAVPWVTYTEPELAHVGLLASEALKDPNLKITEFAFAELDRAQAENKINGKIKIITGKKAKILGVSIVGAHAGELILPWVIAVKEGKSLRTFTDAIAAYPTFSEISKRVAGEYYKPFIFSSKIRTVVRWLNKLG